MTIFVYHLDTPNNDVGMDVRWIVGFKCDLDLIRKIFNADPDYAKHGVSYKMVARVDTDDLEEAWELTNNINHPWTMNDKVSCFRSMSYRSSSVGDVFVKVRMCPESGEWAHQEISMHYVDKIGFEEL